MRFRLTAIALAAVLALGAAKKNVATSKAENEDLILTVTLHPDPADIKELIGDDLQSDCRLTGRFRPEDFVDAPSWESAHAEGRIQRDRACGDGRYRHDRFLRPEPEDGTLSELLFDLA